MRSAAAMKARPLVASRQAAVAITQSRFTCSVSQSARKRFSARSAFLDGVLGQQAGGLHLAAEAAELFLVEDRRRRARQPLIDDEADRVGADVDDRDRRPVIEPALRDVRRSRSNA